MVLLKYNYAVLMVV